MNANVKFHAHGHTFTKKFQGMPSIRQAIGMVGNTIISIKPTHSNHVDYVKDDKSDTGYSVKG